MLFVGNYLCLILQIYLLYKFQAFYGIILSEIVKSGTYRMKNAQQSFTVGHKKISYCAVTCSILINIFVSDGDVEPPTGAPAYTSAVYSTLEVLLSIHE